MAFKNLRVVPQLIFGRGGLAQLGDVLRPHRTGPAIFLVDEVHRHRPWLSTLPVERDDRVMLVNVDVEPKTSYVDQLAAEIRHSVGTRPGAVVGIGGGSTMDIAKAVSLMLTNPGSAADYQGWDLVKHPGVYKVGVPTLAGTGAEVSRTTVLTGPTRKLGMNSDYTPFDQIILDADLCATAPRDQRFYTAMDSYIHAVEALRGTFINAFARGFAEKSRDLCREVFLGDVPQEQADEMLLTASYLGGMSIAYSQVGACHALSYGLSFVLGTRHGVGNCIAMRHLGEIYPGDVEEFERMLEHNAITLPTGITSSVTEPEMDEMVRVSMGMVPLWENCFGPDWRVKMPPERCRSLLRRM